MTVNYREAYDIFASNGILFNHESPLRGETFVTRKITRALAEIKLGNQECLYLGNLDARRDWGHAKDYVEAKWRILQHDCADDFVIATGQQHSVRDFVTRAAAELDLMLEWRGAGENEEGFDQTGRRIVAIDARYFRPTEVESLLGDATKARTKLGWAPKISFDDLIKEMVQADFQAAQNRMRQTGT